MFVEEKYVYKCPRLAMTPEQDLWNIIAIIIVLNLLHEDFDTTTASLLETGNKTIN